MTKRYMFVGQGRVISDYGRLDVADDHAMWATQHKDEGERFSVYEVTGDEITHLYRYEADGKMGVKKEGMQ